MQFRSDHYEVSEILKSTKARWWGDLKLGDIVQFKYIPSRKTCYSGHRTATYITCVNISQDTSMEYSQTELTNYLKKFVLQSCVVRI